jgi:thymidylate kinase
MKTRIICFDGSDAVGKTTQIQYLGNLLADRGIQVKNTRALGGDGSCYFQTQIRKLLLANECPADQTAKEERMFSVSDLFNVKDSMDWLVQNREGVVVQDRGFVSHIVYYMAKGFHPFHVRETHKELFEMYARAADHFGILNIVLVPQDAKMVMERVKSRGGLITTRLENETLQNAVIQQLQEGEHIFDPYPELQVLGLQNVFITVKREDSIPVVFERVRKAFDNLNLQ